MTRFVRATEDDIDNFAKKQKSVNTTRTTQVAMKLLQKYKAEAFAELGDFEDLTESELTTLLKSYFQTITKENGELYEPGTLNTMYYGIVRHFRDQLKIELPKSIMTHIGTVKKSLRRQGKGNLPFKSDALTNAETNSFFDNKAAGDHHPKSLTNAIQIYALILGVRGYHEERKLRFGDLTIVVINGHQFLTINAERVSKANQGEEPRDLRHGVGVLAELPNHPLKCPVKNFLEYGARRPTEMKDPDSPMFLVPDKSAPKDYRKPFTNDVWYYPAPVGANVLGKTVKGMVDLTQLDVGGRKITNTSVRKMVVNTLGNEGVPHKRIMAYTGHRSSSSLVHYDCLNCEEGTDISNLLLMGDATYTRHPPPPVLLASPSDNRRPRPADNTTDTRGKRRRVTVPDPGRQSFALELDDEWVLIEDEQV